MPFNMDARISALIKNNFDGTTVPYYFLHNCADILDEFTKYSEDASTLYNVDIDEDVPSSSFATKSVYDPCPFLSMVKNVNKL